MTNAALIVAGSLIAMEEEPDEDTANPEPDEDDDEDEGDYFEEDRVNEFTTANLGRAELIKRAVELDCSGTTGDDGWVVELPSGYHVETVRPTAEDRLLF